MVFQIAREIRARISRGHSRGIFKSNPAIIAIDPRVSETERLWSLNKMDRFPIKGIVPQNQNRSPIPIRK
jgi:hypothetical protein